MAYDCSQITQHELCSKYDILDLAVLDAVSVQDMSVRHTAVYHFVHSAHDQEFHFTLDTSTLEHGAALLWQIDIWGHFDPESLQSVAQGHL